jgi:5-(carboxyamino)imidazole ribonucleotide mutase
MNNDKPLVGIIMGSDSDLPLMQDAAKVLEEFGIPHEITIVSAHRTPDRMIEYAKSAAERGLKVIIACAGGSAHLPGMTASYTPLPIIGVPRELKTMKGLDSLLSIVQMPPGIPVATVSVDGAKNAGLLAARIVGTGDKNVQDKVGAYQKDLENQILGKAKKLENISYKDYLEETNK